jgi:hypothetical protein
LKFVLAVNIASLRSNSPPTHSNTPTRLTVVTSFKPAENCKMKLHKGCRPKTYAAYHEGTDSNENAKEGRSQTSSKTLLISMSTGNKEIIFSHSIL